MNLEELSDDAKKENILAVILRMSKVDGIVHDNEMMYIVQLGLSLDMEEEAIRQIAHNTYDELHVPTSEQERMTIFYYLIFLMKIDGEISDKETELLHHFGLKLGFNHLLIENVIRVVRANLGKKLPPHSLIEEIKKYHN